MLRVRNLSFGYTNKPFLKNLSFNIDRGENVSVIGASGCGKSTLLQSIYGLHHVDGKIFWEDKQLLGPNFNIVPGEDFMKYLTQDFDLMPSLSAADNVGKFLSNMYPRKKQQRVNELLELVEMKEFGRVKAKHLSGGQQQRVALARVLAKPPEVLLLDEPFSHIDHFRKNRLRRNLFSHLKKNNITVMVATHDSTDALSFADSTLVMKAGRIIAKGSPEELYQDPKNAYVGSLFGEINELPAEIFLPKQTKRKKIVLYPHEIRLTTEEGYKAIVKNTFFKGSHFLTEVALPGDIRVFLETSIKLPRESTVHLEISEKLLQKRLR
ncbi:ABC transporter ATP-binding protein [Salinimicrobium flavum]|uniref:ABC transporter ATP-binding protein n=1 Tax=Salinimicrobium flavum TaxID=1737065 RepID=A0ABW5IUI1_9FLAO